MTKTMKQFESENLGKKFGCYTCNRVFSYKQWNGSDKKTILVAACYDGCSWEGLYAEDKATGEEHEMVCTYGESKSDLIDMIEGC